MIKGDGFILAGLMVGQAFGAHDPDGATLKHVLQVRKSTLANRRREPGDNGPRPVVIATSEYTHVIPPRSQNNRRQG